jgi:hypothetical protein
VCSCTCGNGPAGTPNCLNQIDIEVHVGAGCVEDAGRIQIRGDVASTCTANTSELAKAHLTGDIRGDFRAPPGSCAVTKQEAKLTSPDAGLARICEPRPTDAGRTTSGGDAQACADHRLCAPPASHLCVTPAGVPAATPCPVGFGNELHAANGVTDTRGCSPCNCDMAVTCKQSPVTLRSSSNCSGAGYDLPMGACANAGLGTATQTVEVDASFSGTFGACAPTPPPTPTGSVAFNVVQRLCCTP